MSRVSNPINTDSDHLQRLTDLQLRKLFNSCKGKYFFGGNRHSHNSQHDAAKQIENIHTEMTRRGLAL
ncbi:hypothetical protein [Enterovibrio nigricans]|uniref:Uncharacterized protein n=1 Tax=Enterovibrio nigricans DSM 22720 TaxID=1121868 RepID=A0A1T4WFU6_9GAMM|nr:hypothetical protein [Enterovibrio nigricans]PKF48669.1 hypothetical protein AT251_24395 [Enterovibrio nigricans]SKA76183.1 hypothetical protein SAMN02745132_04916 [Enterovibrio nigricans DSM 22720]